MTQGTGADSSPDIPEVEPVPSFFERILRPQFKTQLPTSPKAEIMSEPKTIVWDDLDDTKVSEKPKESPAPPDSSTEEAGKLAEPVDESSPASEPKVSGDEGSSVKETARFLAMEDWLRAGRPRKRLSFQRFFWWLYTFVYKYRWLSWIPQPRAFGSYRSEISRLDSQIKSRRAKSGGIISVITASGGATKSTITTWLAVVLAFVQRFSVGVFDTDTGVGQVQLRYNLDGDQAVPVDDLVELVTEHDYEPDYNELAMSTVADNATGVLVYHCKPGTKMARDAVSKTVKVISKKHQYVIGDTAPGLGRNETYGLVDASGVTLVVGRAEALDNRNGIREALNHAEYGFGEDRKQVVVVLSGVKRSKFNTRTQYRQAKNFGVDPEQIVLVPADNYVIRKTQLDDRDEADPQVLLDMMEGKYVNLDKIRPKTRYAFYKVADAVTERMVRYNEEHPRPTIQEVLKEKRDAKSKSLNTQAPAVTKAPEDHVDSTQLDSSEPSEISQ